MIIIAHRGNVDGPNPERENNPDYIDEALSMGYDVEIDLRSKDKQLFLGHDKPQYKITWWWLAKRNDQLWIHCKDLNTLDYLTSHTSGYNYFWHENDAYTLTSKKFIWSNPNMPSTLNTVILMPEWSNKDFSKLKVKNCYGICSDYVGQM